jgi:hypothetical protein
MQIAPIAPCVPHWRTLERASEMPQVDDHMLRCVAFLGEGGGSSFRATGTCSFAFVKVDEYDFIYLITAGHVVWPHRRTRAPKPSDPIALRVNQHDSDPKVIPLNRGEWIFPDDVHFDICAFEFDPAIYNQDRKLIYSEMDLQTITFAVKADECEKFGVKSMPDHWKVTIGDDVFITGAFISRIGDKSNIPILRAGTVAALPHEPVEYYSPRHAAYLIETRSLGGISGSPVFLNTSRSLPRGTNVAQRTEGGVRFPYGLIGMVLGTSGSSEYIKDFDPPAEEQKTDADFNSGISIVLPARRILEFLYSDPFSDSMAAAVERRRQIAGLREH